MASFTISIQANAWTEQVDEILKSIEHVDAILDELGEDVVLPILARHYDASGIKQGGIYGGRHVGILKPAITKRGSFGNIFEKLPGMLTVGVSYEAIPYARWVIEGRGPVRPKRKKVLHWIDPDTGKDVFRKSVGPAPPHPIYWLSAQELKEVSEALTRLVLERMK